MDKTKLLKAISRLSEASTTHFAASNYGGKGSPERAAKLELDAARAMCRLCGVEATDSEIADALGW